MQMILYTIHDTIAKEYAPPFVAKNDELAKRKFQQVLMNTPYPSDFELVKLAEYDTDSGCVKSYSSVMVVEYLIPDNIKNNQKGLELSQRSKVQNAK